MNSQRIIQHAFYRILRSLAKVALRYGFSAGSMTELLKRAYVEAAEASLVDEGKKPLSSRLSALTGFYRKEIVRIKDLPPIGDAVTDDRYNRSARVISGWLRDSDYLTKAGNAAVLKVDGDCSFSTLVKRYSGDMTPSAMLEELLRLQVVEMTTRGAIRLKNRAYIPQTSDLDVLQILGTDTADLIETIHYNIQHDESDRRFQRKVSYVHIPEQHVENFRLYAASESQALLEKLNQWLAERDTEVKSNGSPGSRLGLGIYMFDEENGPSALAADDDHVDP